MPEIPGKDSRYQRIAPEVASRIRTALFRSMGWRNPGKPVESESERQMILEFIQRHPGAGYYEGLIRDWLGTVEPSWPKLSRLAQDLNVPVAWLACGQQAIDEAEKLLQFKKDRRHLQSVDPPRKKARHAG